jgi:hypothetical protein
LPLPAAAPSAHALRRARPAPRFLPQAERIYWDQATVLAQVGLLDASTLPVSGVEQAGKAADASSVPANWLVNRSA